MITAPILAVALRDAEANVQKTKSQENQDKANLCCHVRAEPIAYDFENSTQGVDDLGHAVLFGLGACKSALGSDAVSHEANADEDNGEAGEEKNPLLNLHLLISSA
jgi:hypothetical protein